MKCIPNRVVIQTSENAPIDNNINNMALQIIEQKIEKEELDQFLNTWRTGAEWSGNIESTNLYKVWLAKKKKKLIPFPI
jgi:hypothetical protein